MDNVVELLKYIRALENENKRLLNVGKQMLDTITEQEQEILQCKRTIEQLVIGKRNSQRNSLGDLLNSRFSLN